MHSELYNSEVYLNAAIQTPDQPKSLPDALKYYATFKVKKFVSLLYKTNTCLQKKLPLARAEQIFSVNI